jgi:hypothetical protein
LAASAILVASPVGASPGHHPIAGQSPVAPTVIKVGPVDVGDCPPGTIEATVTIPRTVFTVNQPVSVRAVVRNTGTVPCDYAGLSAKPQEAGPCGMLSMEVENARGLDVWPGNVAYNCQAEFEESIPPKGSVVAVGSWSQDEGTLAPRGRYRLIVGRKLAFSITLR